MATVVRPGSAQAQAQKEISYYAVIYRANGEIEKINKIHRLRIRSKMRTFTDLLLGDDVEAIHIRKR